MQQTTGTGDDGAAGPLRELASRSVVKRSDSRATRDKLIRTVGRLLAEHGTRDVSLPEVAEAARVSTATAYRHFASGSDLVSAFVLGFPEVVRAAYLDRLSGRGGVGALRLLCDTWVEETVGVGAALVHLRSPRGFLERRAAGESVIAYVCKFVEPPLLAAMDDRGVAPAELPFLLLIWNALYDPREIIDLRTTEGWTVGQIQDRLFDVFLATIAARS